MEDEATKRCPRCEQDNHADEPACRACGILLGTQRACTRHPDRDAVGLCVMCGDAVCDDCDEGSDTHCACPQHAAVPIIEGWAQIYTTSDVFEADLIKENLQAEGLDAEVLSQKDRSFSVELGDLSPVRILVPAYVYIDAAQLLAAHMDRRGEVVFACPTCGEAFEPGDAVCRSCGAALPTAGAAPPLEPERREAPAEDEPQVG